MWIIDQNGLWGLFLLCFLAATILPLSSEVFVLTCLHYSAHPDGLIVAIATAGNSLGGLTNYLIGFYGSSLWQKRFGFGQKNRKIQDKLRSYGPVAAFLSWLPFIGDPLLVALGFYRSPFWKTMTWMVSGKLLRYLALLLAGI